MDNHFFLSAIIFAPLFFALIIASPLIKETQDGKNIHRLALTFSAFLFLFSLVPWLPGVQPPQAELIPWFPSLGIHYALGSDGLSWTLVVLTTFLVMLAVVASHTNITKRLKLYYSMVFVLMASILGVFLSRDLFLFFLFWELELIPMYFLIAIWGGPRRDYAAIKFVLYTLFGSVFLVAGMLALYFHTASTGADTASLFLFDTITNSIQGQMALSAQILVFVALFITFAVKLPMVPFHTWLPDAHVEAPTPVSMLLAGILLKMGAYGMLRICFGFLPDAAVAVAPVLALLAFINIVYTAGVALVQKDMKKLIAYSSVSHMGFVLLGLAALNQAGYSGAVFVMLSHGLVSAALFMCVGTLYIRTHSREIADYGGFGSQTPIIFYFFMFMAMASLGLPLLVSFPGETLVFYGAFLSNAAALGSTWLPFGLELNWSIQTFTILSAIGVILGAAYLLWLLQRVFFGKLPEKWKTLNDATPSEVLVLGTLALFVLIYGLFPQWLIDRYQPSLEGMADTAVQTVLISSTTKTGVVD